MDADIKDIYNRLHSEYSLELTSSFEQGFKTNIDYPVLCGTSVLGRFVLFYGDIDFEFYVLRDNGECWVHCHLKSAKEAEQTVVDFMNDKLTLISFGKPYDT